jgi:bacterioferritin
MERQQLIEHLEGDLALEYQSILQYIAHIASVKGAMYQQIVHEMEAHLEQEVRHALIVARQIDFLGGKPSMRVAEPPQVSTSEDALKADLRLEQTQLERYRERIEEAHALGLPDVAEALAPVLRETQAHARELMAALWKPTGLRSVG